MAGTKETKELLDLVRVVGCAIIERAKDGVDFDDVGALLNDDKLIATAKTGIEGAIQIPVELSDLGVFEGLDLARHGNAVIADIMDCLKKPAQEVLSA